MCERLRLGTSSARPDRRVRLNGIVKDISRHVPPLVDRYRPIDPWLTHLAVVPERRPKADVPDDVSVVIDLKRAAPVGATWIEVDHLTVLPQKGVERAGRSLRGPDHLSGVIDVPRVTGRAAERAQVNHDAVVPEKRVRRS